MKWIFVFLIAMIVFIKWLPDEAQLAAVVEDPMQAVSDLLSSAPVPRQLLHTTHQPDEPEHSFRCDGRTHCPQMTSCAEATFFLQNCPGVKMDGNHDGVPCERQWCN